MQIHVAKVSTHVTLVGALDELDDVGQRVGGTAQDDSLQNADGNERHEVSRSAEHVRDVTVSVRAAVDHERRRHVERQTLRRHKFSGP